VRGMLPKTKLGEAMWRKLKVYADATHPHQAQKPKSLGARGRGKNENKSEVA
jgi:large subunit ribosomal protein L13